MTDVKDYATRSLASVQALRAVAAVLVLVGHTVSNINHAAAATGAPTPTAVHVPGGFGVDLFFAISGFIMVISSERLFGQPGAGRTFLERRLIRIVPLYWLATLAYVPVLLAGSHGYPGNLAKALLTSLALIPYPTYGVDSSGNIYPILQAGWTLNYEIFFYILFTACIALPRRWSVCATITSLVTIALAGQLIGSSAAAARFWTQPIILEFAGGLCIAALWMSRPRVHATICLALVVFALAVLALDPLSLAHAAPGTSTPNDLRRVAGWGLPAAALLFACVFLERASVSRGATMRILCFLGDCSYSLYLTHAFVLIFLIKLWEQWRLGATLGITLLGVAAVGGSLGLAAAVHLTVEKTATRALRQWLARRSDPAGLVTA